MVCFGLHVVGVLTWCGVGGGWGCGEVTCT